MVVAASRSSPPTASTPRNDRGRHLRAEPRRDPLAHRRAQTHEDHAERRQHPLGRAGDPELVGDRAQQRRDGPQGGAQVEADERDHGDEQPGGDAARRAVSPESVAALVGVARASVTSGPQRAAESGRRRVGRRRTLRGDAGAVGQQLPGQPDEDDADQPPGLVVVPDRALAGQVAVEHPDVGQAEMRHPERLEPDAPLVGPERRHRQERRPPARGRRRYPPAGSGPRGRRSRSASSSARCASVRCRSRVPGTGRRRRAPRRPPPVRRRAAGAARRRTRRRR